MSAAPHSVLLGLWCSASPRAAMETGVEFARLFGLPVRGLYIEEERALEVYQFPEAFRPRLRERPGTDSDVRRMLAALAREGRRLRGELEELALRSRLEHSFDVQRGEPLKAMTALAGEGDLVVIPVDLGDPGLGHRMQQAARLSRRTGGVLLVPGAPPAGSRRVVALAGAGAARLHGIAGDIAAGLGAALSLVLPGVSDEAADEIAVRLGARLGPAVAVEGRALAAEGRLDAEALNVPGLRLLVAGADLVERIEATGAASPLRRFRAPLLVVSEEHARDTAGAGGGTAPERGRSGG